MRPESWPPTLRLNPRPGSDTQTLLKSSLKDIPKHRRRKIQQIHQKFLLVIPHLQTDVLGHAEPDLDYTVDCPI